MTRRILNVAIAATLTLAASGCGDRADRVVQAPTREAVNQNRPPQG